jgi:type IV secretion system protein TrbD
MDMTDKPRETMIHKSANRPNLLLGGDRELVLVMVMIAGGLAFSLAAWWGIGLAAVLWVGAMGALQRMGKADPLLRPVYLRHIRYGDFYPAKSGLHGRTTETPSGWR